MGTEANKLTVREEINQRLDALTPEQFIIPTIKSDESMHFVCMATDEIKRLFTFCEHLSNKYEALRQKERELCRDAKERIQAIGRKESGTELKTPGSPLFLINENLKHVGGDLRRTDLLGNFVNASLFLEIENQHEDLENRADLRICDDWSLCYVDAPPVPVITQVVFRAPPRDGPDESGGNGEPIPHKRLLH